MDFFYNSICHVCKIIENDLKRCASCRSVAYCSKEHQVSDWNNHKQMCKLFSHYKKHIKLEDNCGYSRWRLYRLQLKFHLEQKLARRLFSHESQMWMFPRNCAVCYSSGSLKDCLECFCVAYCSSEHRIVDRERHYTFCSKLRLCLELDRFNITNPKIDVKFKEISQNIQCLPSTIHEAIKLFVDISEVNNYLEEVCVSDIFASMLTVLYGLEKCKCLINRKILTDTLVIHIVGADVSELSLNWKHMSYFLQLWIQNLKNCEIMLIGPDLKLHFYEFNSSENIKFQCLSYYYHDVVEKIDKPDIIIAFNSGLHEFHLGESNDTWHKSLSCLITNNAPLLLTAYTKNEIEKDLERLNSFSNLEILKSQINPFSNLRPIRDWDSPENEPFHVNRYIAIISGPEYSNFKYI